MESTAIEVVSYRPEHQPWFEKLNRDWIEKYFWMEPIDFEVLQHPEQHILKHGGTIFIGTYNKEIAGTAAVKFVEAGVFEFTKMAVDEKFQGKKIGKAIAEHAIEWCRRSNARRIILYSNTKLETAIAMYRKLGFVEIALDGPYKRSDIKMELKLAARMRKKIAFVTSSVKPDFAGNDLHVVESLKSLGAEVHPLPWDDDRVQWTAFDLVVLRSCWNYQLHPEKFQRWLVQLEQKKVRLANTGKTARWNLHKGYLNELCKQGVDTPETFWVPKGSTYNLASLLKTKQWDKAVVKPAISANALNTFLFSDVDAVEKQGKFDALAAQGDMLIQKFIPEVQEKGEWSLIFFNKKFSHAVIKRPASKDFRVQHDFGGTATPAVPPSAVLQQAEKILELINEPLLFARVDGVVSENKFILMELELIEPVLFLEKENGSAEGFAQAMKSYIENYN